MTKTKFVCWKPDLGETEESDGRVMEAYNAEEAAEKAVERNFWDDPSEEDTDVCVRVPLKFLKDEWSAKGLYGSPGSEGPEPTTNEVQRFVVHVESQPVFNARRKKKED